MKDTAGSACFLESLAKLQFDAEVGPELILLADGLQPFMFRTGSGAIVVQAEMSYPPGAIQQDKDPYPGLPGTVVSRDNGATPSRASFGWQR